ncbi:nutrient deprivation-induced protein [Rhizobium sp. F40D2]
MTNDFSAPVGEGSPSANASPVTDLKNKLNEDVSSTREMIKEGSGAVIEKVDEVVSEQTHYAAHQVSGIATALEKVGAELEGADQRQVGRYAREIGRSIADVAKRIEGKDLGEMATLAEDFGRRQPMAFLGIAALAGLTASRFLIASAKRNDQTRPTGPSQAVRSVSGSEGNSND